MIDSKIQYYDKEYFQWQKPMGKFAGWANKVMFYSFIKPDSRVLDFGCGGGYLLNELICEQKIGLEINTEAVQAARSNGIEVYTDIDEIPDGYVDRVISDNALEHIQNPLGELKRLRRKVKREGLMIFVVPCEGISWSYKPGDINQHLYSWSPMSLGNLFTLAGYEVRESKPFVHKWPPFHMTIAKVLPSSFFHLVCRLYGHIDRRWFQVRIVAENR